MAQHATSRSRSKSRSQPPEPPRPDPEFTHALLHWYDGSGRDLPWRRTRDPYAIWVSEIMLQQTRVETVIPYYERFLSRFPSVHALADADVDDVLAHWSGLGYYSRARNLHRGAGIVSERFEGRFPHDPEDATALPGIGPYTCAAILSIAYGSPLAVVDGNVARVLARLFRIEVTTGTIDGNLRRAAQSLLDTTRPADWNQAMMELGARICTPRQPSCETCPVEAHCQARAAGRAQEYPRPKPRRATVELPLDLFLLRDPAGRLLMEKEERPLLANFWLPPLRLREAPQSESTADPTAIRTTGGTTGRTPIGTTKARDGDPLAAFEVATMTFYGIVRHAVTHHRIIAHVWGGRIGREATARPTEGSTRAFFTADDLAGIGRSSLLTKALRREGAGSPS